MTQRKTDLTQAPYRALVAQLAGLRPWSLRDIELTEGQVHTVFLHHADLAQEALNNAHLAADLADELNSVYSADTLNGRLADRLLVSFQTVACRQIYEDVQDEIFRREDAEEAREEAERLPGSHAFYERGIDRLDAEIAL